MKWIFSERIQKIVVYETLKQKIVDLNKEVYQLKNELNSYKSVGLGFYKKKEVYVWE